MILEYIANNNNEWEKKKKKKKQYNKAQHSTENQAKDPSKKGKFSASNQNFN